MISVSQARIQILDSLSLLPIETIKLENSRNRVLAEPIIADQDSPSFDNSSMDGIALVAADIASAHPDHPVQLELIGSIPAGLVAGEKISKGKAIQIMTGAPIPDGADTVVQVEHTDLDFSKPVNQDTVLVRLSSQKGTNIRRQGEFYKKGDALLSPGHKMRAQDTAVVAMTGKPTVKVRSQPKVGLLTTGDELVPPGKELLPGKIRDTNSYMLASLLEDSGADVIRTGIIPDTEEAVLGALQFLVQSGVHLILTSGGVSMGAYDIVRRVLEAKGTLKLWRVNMRPGKPLAFGEFQNVPFIGLPGNPVSAFVGFNIFVRPALMKMSGEDFIIYPLQKAKLKHSVESDGRESYIPANLSQADDEWVVEPAVNQSSGNLFALIPGNSLIIVPNSVKFLSKGELVSVLKLDPA